MLPPLPPYLTARALDSNPDTVQEAAAAREAAAAAKQQVALLLQAQGPADNTDHREEVQQLQQQVEQRRN